MKFLKKLKNIPINKNDFWLIRMISVFYKFLIFYVSKPQ